MCSLFYFSLSPSLLDDVICIITKKTEDEKFLFCVDLVTKPGSEKKSTDFLSSNINQSTSTDPLLIESKEKTLSAVNH